MVGRRSRSRADENRSRTPDNTAVNSPRSRKCLDLTEKGPKPLAEINGWKSGEQTPSKECKSMDTHTQPFTPASSEIIPRTPANYISPETMPRTPAGGTGWSYTDLTTPRSALSGSSRRRSLMITPRSKSNTPKSKFVVPDQFKVVPASAIKKEPKQEVLLPEIQSKSFYGGAPPAEEKFKSPNAPSASDQKVKAMSEPKRKVLSSSGARRESSVTKFRKSMGGIKRKREGLNKGGFGHGIKKPKKKPRRVDIKVSEMKARSIEIPGSKVASSSTPTESAAKPSEVPNAKSATPNGKSQGAKSATALTPKTGNFAVTKDTNVDYELKGGQIVYRRNKTPGRKLTPKAQVMSPMKQSYFNGERPKPPKSRLSGGKLFSPANDYMQPEEMSPVKYVPSPVKFSISTDDGEDDEPETNHISDLINRLEVEDEDLNQPPPPAISGQSLHNSGMELSLQSGDIDEMTMNNGGGFVDLDPEISAYNAVQEILGDMQESSGEVQDVGISSENVFVENNSSSQKEKLFPIFYKETAQSDTFSPTSDKQKGRRTYVCKDPRQLVLDVGQERGPTQCLTCGAIYNKGNPEDESSHEKAHNQVNEKLKYLGWRKEKKCMDDLDGKVVQVQPGDLKFMWKKVDDVLSVVDKDLGFAEPGKIRNPGESKVYMYICDKKVAGFVLAESIQNGYRIIPKESDEPSNTYTCSVNPEPARVGISRIWVLHDYRHRRIATKLVDCVRSFFILGQAIKKEELAFSDPTVNGISFASHYTQTQDFLVYR
eukprot:TRINITY_DN8055_c0_g2_i1.p1 TRINITY_DN8055_c0_g2~~TRINITY_DN8055_c0_g2_i1.p1  ORF type:complete len:769 (-),score=169.71 TRINITY_DN8055_c0_g2_i1:433-2739(-)